jgi:hypothetical protein
MKRSALFSALALSSMGALTLAGCGGSSECTTPTTGQTAKAVVKQLLLPTSNKQYGFDLNGDSIADNQLGQIIGSLTTVGGLQVQPNVDTAVNNGDVVVLMTETGADLTSNTCAQTTLQLGTETATPPTFNGSDTFTVDATQPTGTFKGAITAGTFTSNNPATSTTPTELTILLPLVEGQPPLPLKVTGARVTFTKSGDNLTNGQLNGAVRKTDIDSTIIPAVAVLLTNIINDTTSSSAATIETAFDTGGCSDGGTMAAKGDKKISTCEVAGNSIIKGVLKADVQMFDNGVFKPSAANTTPDSMSLGVKFEAVKATF